MLPTKVDFVKELEAFFSECENIGLPYVNLTAGQLYRRTIKSDSIPPNHRVPTCCTVMREKMKCEYKFHLEKKLFWKEHSSHPLQRPKEPPIEQKAGCFLEWRWKKLKIAPSGKLTKKELLLLLTFLEK